ncbi:MAG: trigger factor, partial [Gemmatimonadota bacterium]
RELVIQDVIREGWDVAVESQGLKPVADPSIRNLKFEAGQPVEFELLVEVKPEIVLERITGFTVSRTLAPVTDEQVADQLDQLRDKKAAWLPVEGAMPAPGMRVEGEVASIEGDTVHEGKPFTLVLGEGDAIPELEEQIMQLLPGATADTDVRFPDDHPDLERRGQSRRVRITLREVKRKELPPLDDGFAAEVGEFADLNALKTAVRADLAQDAEREADRAVRESLIGQIAEANGVTPPPSLVERVLHGFAHGFNIPQEQYDTFAAQFRPVAMQQVRRDLVLGAVAEQETLRATEAELDERIGTIAAARGVAPGEVYRSLQEAKRLGELERSITEEKIFAFLLSGSTVTEETS